MRDTFVLDRIHIGSQQIHDLCQWVRMKTQEGKTDTTVQVDEKVYLVTAREP